MEAFKINEIEVVDEDKIPVEKLLTGDVVKGLDPKSPIQPNAELENEEYVQFPDGTTQQVVGKTHEKGGVKMSIPDQTKVVSDTLTPTKEQVKALKKNYGLEVSTKNTFAEILEKYSAQIGLKKLNKEQEEVFIEMKKVMEADTDKNTQKVNQSYLSGKIYDLEQRKLDLEKDREELFDVVFNMQEGEKPEEAVEEGNFRNGGLSERNFEAVCKKMGISPEQGRNILKNGGYVSTLQKFADGGVFETLKTNLTKYKATWTEAEFRNALNTHQKDNNLTEKQVEELSNLWREVPSSTSAAITLEPAEEQIVKNKWNNDKEAYLKFKQTKLAIQGNPEFRAKLYDQYSKVIEDPANYTKQKKESWRNALAGRTEDEVVQALLDQEERNARLAAFKFDAKTTSQSPAKGSLTNKEAEELIKKNSSGLGDLKFDKGYLSQAAYIAYDDVMKQVRPPEGYDINQVGVADELKNRNATISGIDNANTNTTLGQRLDYLTDIPAAATPQTPGKTTPVPPGTPIEDKVVLPRTPGGPRAFFTPDQSALPPSPMDAHLMTDIRLQRIDPLRIGIENNLQEIADQRIFVADQLDALPDSQRAAAMANLLATSQKTANTAITNANVVNAQNQSQAELFNIQQSDKEQAYGANNALSFEQRQLTAKAKTEEELRRYYDYMQNVNVNNFQNQQRLNLVDSLFPDFNLDFYGSTVNYDPNSQFTIEDRRRLLALMNSAPPVV